MTTPAAPTVPVAPAALKTAADFLNQSDEDLFFVAPTEEGQPPVTPVSAPEPVVPSAETPPVVEPVPEPVSAPDTAALTGLGRAPITEFTVFDPEGEVEIPALKIKFKAVGKERELDIDHVVRLAQYGFANKEREDQVVAAKHFVAEAQQKEADLNKQLAEFQQYYDRILNDPAFYEEARESYARHNGPEARADRLERELQQTRAQQAQMQESQIQERFVSGTLVPTTTRLLSENPLVSDTELIGRWTQLTAPLLVQGRVPVQRLPDVERLMKEDLTQWVGALQLERSTTKKQESVQQLKDQTQLTQAKRQAARALAPTGAVASSQDTKPVKFKTADQWLSTTFGTSEDD